MALGERFIADRQHLIASGKDAEVLVRPDGLLVKRSRLGTSLADEARLLRYLRGHGLPVPDVVEVRDGELVMEYVPGPTMAEELSARPWRAPVLGYCLAGLHRQLADTPAPPWLPAVGRGNSLLHMDLHPGNVVLGPAGPVVLDWGRAARGSRHLDVALSWLVLASAKLTRRSQITRWLLLRAFLARVDRAGLRAALPAAAAYRLSGPDRGPEECALVRRAVAAMS